MIIRAGRPRPESGCHNQGRGDRRDSLVTASKPEVVGGGRGDRHRGTQGSAEHCLGLGTPSRHPGALPDDLDGNVAHSPPGGLNTTPGLGQESNPRGTSPLRLLGAVVRSHIAQPACRQQGVAHGMGDDIAIRMASEPHWFFREIQSSHPHPHVGHQPVDIGAYTGADVHGSLRLSLRPEWCPRAERTFHRASATVISVGSVIFIDNLDPGTKVTA